MNVINDTSVYDSDYYLVDDYETDLCDVNTNSDIGIFIQTCVHTLICALGLLGNTLVIITYMFYKRAKTMTDVYLLNVAIADLLLVVALPLIIYNEQHDWSMGSLACKVLRGAYSINLYSGMLLLACVSGDRYVAIVQARRSFGIRSKAVVYSRLICFAIWALAIALSIPTVIYNERVTDTDPRETISVCQMEFYHKATAKLMKVLVPSLQVSIGFFLPLLIMVVCYSRIVCTLLTAQSIQRHKAVRVVFAVVVVFIICHMPYNVTLLQQTLRLFQQRECPAEKMIITTLNITRSLAYLHCCINPILYAFIGVKFRNTSRKILEDLWCMVKRCIYSRRTLRQTSDLYVSVRKSTEGSNQENRTSFTM